MSHGDIHHAHPNPPGEQYAYLLTQEFHRKVDRAISEVTVSHDYDVPYLAGYSNDGKTIFIDRRLPARLPWGQVTFPTVAPLLRHEVPEKLLERYALPYLTRHKIVTHWFEKPYVVGTLHVPWKHYEAEMDGYIREVEHESVTRPPPTLDLSPYSESERIHLRSLMAKVDADRMPVGDWMKHRETTAPAKRN